MAKIYIKTFGCTVNQSDSEVMVGLLQERGFDIVIKKDYADLIIVNTCIVKSPTEKKVLRYINKVNESGKFLVIAGCITKTSPKQLLEYSLISPKNINNIAKVVEQTLNGNIVHMIVDDNNPRLNLPKIRKNKIIEIIPICSGCLGAPCAYCTVKKARGHLISYDPDEIIRQAQHAVRQGIKEIWITAQDTGAYGHDIGILLPEVLKKITALHGDFKIRLGMINPNHALEFIDELVEVFKNDKMFKFIHLPVQSGNNNVLKKMKRKYTVEDFKSIVHKLRSAIPDITIATDIICGFPGETQEQFNDTIELVRWLNPDRINRSKYGERKGTSASRMKNKVDSTEIKKRSTCLADLFKNIGLMINEKWYDWIGDIIIDEIGKDNSFVGRNYAYKPIIVKGDYRVGDTIKVRINKITWFDLRGKEVRKIKL